MSLGEINSQIRHEIVKLEGRRPQITRGILDSQDMYSKVGLETVGRASQALELLFSLERSSKFSWLIIGMNNASEENSCCIKIC